MHKVKFHIEKLTNIGEFNEQTGGGMIHKFKLPKNARKVTGIGYMVDLPKYPLAPIIGLLQFQNNYFIDKIRFYSNIIMGLIMTGAENSRKVLGNLTVEFNNKQSKSITDYTIKLGQPISFLSGYSRKPTNINNLFTPCNELNKENDITTIIYKDSGFTKASAIDLYVYFKYEI